MRRMLSETVVALCRNTLNYKAQFSIEGLFGITLDNEEIFLVNIKETITKVQNTISPEKNVSKRTLEGDSDGGSSQESGDNSQGTRKRKRKRKQSPIKIQMGVDGNDSSTLNETLQSADEEEVNLEAVKRERLESDEDGMLKEEEGDEEEEEENHSYLMHGQSEFALPGCGGISEESDLMGQLPNLSYQMANLQHPANLPNMVSDVT